MAHLTPTLRSILDQSRRPDEVAIYVPRTYRRPEFNCYELPTVPEGIEIRICDFDFGPATKVLPATLAYAGSDTVIVYCDDDQIYDREWLSRLLAVSRTYPGECIADRGLRVGKIDAHSRPKDLAYRARRIASLGLWHPRKALDVPAGGLVDIALGYGGVLIRPEFIPPTAYEIPGILWTVDDIWLSGQMVSHGVRIRQASGARRSANGQAAALAPLLDTRIEAHDRTTADQACVDYFRRNYGIWRS